MLMKIVCLFPFYIETMMALNEGNMGLYGIYLSLRYRRNLVYFSFSLVIASVIFEKLLPFSLILFGFSIYFYFIHSLWKFILPQEVL